MATDQVARRNFPTMGKMKKKKRRINQLGAMEFFYEIFIHQHKYRTMICRGHEYAIWVQTS